MTFAEFMVFFVKMLFAAFALYLVSEVVKTYIKHKYSKEVVEAEKEKKSDSLTTYMFRRDDRWNTTYSMILEHVILYTVKWVFC